MTQKKNIDVGKWWDECLRVTDGCTPVSAGCLNCWEADRFHRFHRAKGLTDGLGKWTGEIQVGNLDHIEEKLYKGSPKTFALWNDLFHEDVPFEWIAAVIQRMDISWSTRAKTCLCLTKRIERAAKYFERWRGRKVPPNFWLGTTVETQGLWAKRMKAMAKAQAGTAIQNIFISFEPLLGPIDPTIDNAGVKPRWVIIGVETKNGKPGRPCELSWIRDLAKHFKEQGALVFIKNLSYGSFLFKRFDDQLAGTPFWPEDLRIREVPVMMDPSE